MTNAPDKTVFSQDHKDNLSKSLRGKKKSPEHKAKIAESMKRKAEERRSMNMKEKT